MTLARLNLENNLGKSFEVLGFDGDSLLTERLHEIGLRAGALIKFVGRAPFKGPFLVQFQSTVFAFREEEAQCTLLKAL